MKRREYLLAGSCVTMTALAGCNGNGSDGNEAENGETESAAPPTLESHDIQQMVGGVEVVVAMSNQTEEMLNRAYGEVNVYNDDTRLANGRAAVIDLESGITDSESALLEEFSPDDVTHYTITVSGETEDFEKTESEEFEFDGEELRNRLSE